MILGDAVFAAFGHLVFFFSGNTVIAPELSPKVPVHLTQPPQEEKTFPMIPRSERSAQWNLTVHENGLSRKRRPKT